MQALTYHGRKDVRVETVPDPVLAAEDDLILRVTATAICGSDLHLYRGKIPDLNIGDVLGHEFMGIVEEVGRAGGQAGPRQHHFASDEPGRGRAGRCDVRCQVR